MTSSNNGITNVCYDENGNREDGLDSKSCWSNWDKMNKVKLPWTMIKR